MNIPARNDREREPTFRHEETRVWTLGHDLDERDDPPAPPPRVPFHHIATDLEEK